MRLKDKQNSYFHLFCIFEIIFATDTFIAFANVNENIKHIFQLLIILSTLVLVIESLRSKRDFMTCLLWGGGLILFACCSMIFNRDFSNGNLIKIIVLIFGMFFSYNVGFEFFRSKFVSIMKIIAIFSVCTFILTPLIQKFGSFLPTLSNGKYAVYYLVLSNVPVRTQVLRNWGPFWEPGVFQIYLGFALILSLYNAKSDKIANISFMVAILTTFSTSGYLILALILLSYLARRKKLFPQKEKIRFSKGKLFILAILVFCLLVFAIKENIFEVIFGKLNPNSSAFSSTNSRLMSIYANLDILRHNIFFGCGSAKIDGLYNNYVQSVSGMKLSNTNGLLLNFAVFGGFFGIIYCYLIYKTTFQITTDNVSRVMIFICIVLMLFSEPLINSLLFNSLIFFNVGKKITKNRYRQNLTASCVKGLSN